MLFFYISGIIMVYVQDTEISRIRN